MTTNRKGKKRRENSAAATPAAPVADTAAPVAEIDAPLVADTPAAAPDAPATGTLGGATLPVDPTCPTCADWPVGTAVAWRVGESRLRGLVAGHAGSDGSYIIVKVGDHQHWVAPARLERQERQR